MVTQRRASPRTSGHRAADVVQQVELARPRACRASQVASAATRAGLRRAAVDRRHDGREGVDQVGVGVERTARLTNSVSVDPVAAASSGQRLEQPDGVLLAPADHAGHEPQQVDADPEAGHGRTSATSAASANAASRSAAVRAQVNSAARAREAVAPALLLGRVVEQRGQGLGERAGVERVDEHRRRRRRPPRSRCRPR